MFYFDHYEKVEDGRGDQGEGLPYISVILRTKNFISKFTFKKFFKVSEPFISIRL